MSTHVKVHPAADAWMMGVRYLVPTKAFRTGVRGIHELSGRSVKVSYDNLMPADPETTLYWVIYAPNGTPVDETFSDSYDDALAFAREWCGPDVHIKLDISRYTD